MILIISICQFYKFIQETIMSSLPTCKASLYTKHQNRGFTFVEILIVSALIMVLLGLSAPLVTSLRSVIAIKGTVNQLKTDIITTMGNALAGKSVGALASHNLEDISMIPSHYALVFQADHDYGNVSPYFYNEYTTEIMNNDQYETKLSYSISKDMPSESVFLTDIRLKNNESDIGQSVDDAFIFFSAPFAKVNLISGHNNIISELGSSFNSANDFKDSDFKYIDLVFQFKDDENSRTILTFGVNKVINIS